MINHITITYLENSNIGTDKSIYVNTIETIREIVFHQHH